ncbi:MAG: MFS transporter [Desulfobacterales bacterium]|nr:MFS transporter [Desulfobacterales bacterium]
MRNKIFYGWWVVLATNIICMLGFGTWLYSFGVFFKPMMTEFGWSRALTSGAASLRSTQGGVAGPLVGWAVDKYGARIIILFGGIVSGFGFAMMYFVNSILGFYLFYGIILSIGMSAMLYVPAFTVIAQWFSKKLSLALALLAVGAGIGGLVCAPSVAALITHFGWRVTFLIVGITIWVVVIQLSFVVKNRPAEMGLAPDGDPLDNNDSMDSAAEKSGGKSYGLPQPFDYTLKQAMHTSSFWILALCFFCMSFTHSTLFVHTIPFLTDIGISTTKAALSIGFLTVVSIVGRLLFGYFGDYIDKRYLLMVAYSLMAIGVMILMHTREMKTVYLFIAFFGVGFGAHIPLMPAIRAQYFGRKDLGKIQGSMSPIIMVAGTTGPILAGHLFDTTGSYNSAFMLMALLCVIAGVLVFFAQPMGSPKEILQ